VETKRVYFDYFEVWCHELDADGSKVTEKQFDLTTVWNTACALTPKETMRKHRGEKARIQIVKLRKSIKTKISFWEIQILKLREKSLPGLAKDDGDYQIIKLEDGEYIGESNSLLYDDQGCILVMQRNYNGFTPSGVEDYLYSIISPESDIKRIILKPIIAGSKIAFISKDKIFRTIEIGIATGVNPVSNSPFLTKMLSHFEKYEGTSFKVRISVGRAKRDRTLSPGLTVDTIKELYGDSSVTELRTWLKDSEDVKTEKVDLLDDRRQDFTELLVDRENPISHDRVYEDLKKVYLKRKKDNTIY